MSSPAFVDAVMLFGDSITEAPTAGSFAQRMAEYYNRRLDVINRGFAGYNSEWAVPVLKQVFATKQARQAGQAQGVRLMTIWFGANDAVLEGEAQHVPLIRYKDNLHRLIDIVASPDSPYHSPETKIILINAPPIISDKWHRHARVIRAAAGETAPDKPNRDPKQVQQYAEACVDVAKQVGVPYVDIFNGLIAAAGGNDDVKLDPFLYDGLHLSSAGYQVLFDIITEVIKTSYPELVNEALPTRMPYWGDIDPTNPAPLLDHQAARS